MPTIPWFRSDNPHGVLCTGVWFFHSPPASKSHATDLHSHAGTPCHALELWFPGQSMQRPLLGTSCTPGLVPGVGGCGAGEERCRAWCLFSRAHVSVETGCIHRYGYGGMVPGETRLKSQGLGACQRSLLPGVLGPVAGAGEACLLFCELGPILFLLSSPGSCSESASQLMTTQVL